MQQYVTPHKQALIEQVLEQRTRYLTVVLEDIYKPHNASAVLRTADCMGLADVHIIENDHSYEVNPYVVRGAAQWLNIVKYNEPQGKNTQACFSALKQQGYRIYAATPHAQEQDLPQVPVDHKMALVFGTEWNGLSPYVVEHADGFIKIPMHGFTESFNISVTAAIFLYDLVNKLRASTVNWHLDQSEKESLRYDWYRQIVPHVLAHERKFLRQNGINLP